MCNIWNMQQKNEMEINFFKKIFIESKLLRRLNLITFSGGEPFLKDDLFEFVEVVNRFSSPLYISFATNGLLTDRIVSMLSKMLERKGAPINIKLSVDGVGEVNDKIRGVEGSFNKSMETLSKMKGLRLKYPRGLSISLGFTANSLNYHQMPQIIELAKDHGAGFFYKPIMYAETLQNEGIDKSLFLSSEQMEFLAKYHSTIIANTKKTDFKKKYLYSKYLNFLIKYYKKPARYFPCYACTASFHVSSDWNVFSCLKYTYVLGNLKNASFDEIFNGSQAYSIRKKIKEGSCHCLCTGEIFPSIIVQKFPLFI